MNTSNASSCLHFTKKMDTLKLILTNGIRHSYAFEEFPNSIIENFINEYSHKVEFFESIKLHSDEKLGMAIPMISFFDIPITRAYNHANDYGKYIIGIDKQFFLNIYTHYFNPVMYVNCEAFKSAISFFTSERLKSMDQLYESIKSNKKLLEQLDHIPRLSKETFKDIPENIKKIIEHRSDETYYSYVFLALYKPLYGIDAFGKQRNFFDEREWRLFLPNDYSAAFKWFIACTRNEFLLARDELNKNISTCEDAFVKIPGNCWDAVTHIVVRYEYQRDYLINFILRAKQLFGYKVTPNSSLKLKLISKISSFERIENDY